MRRYLPVGIMLLALAARLAPGPRTIDDAYITFRYARNLLDGLGFVYNPGQPVLGTTTPLYTLTLSTLGALSGGPQAPFPTIALALNAVAGALTCGLLWWIGLRLGYQFAAAAGALAWAVAPFSVTFAIGGLETSLYVLLLVALLAAYISRKHTLSALIGALALLTRPDALILLAPLILDRLWRAVRLPGERLRWSEVAAFGVPSLSWIAFAWATFGTPVPHSLTAKTLAYRLPPEAALVRLLQHYATPFLEHLTFGNGWIAVGLVLYTALFFAGGLAALRAEPRTWPFVLFPILYFCAYALANPLIFRWYLTPPLPFFQLTVLIGAQKILQDVRSQPWLPTGSKAWGPAWAIAAALLAVAPAALSARDWAWRPDHGLQRPAPGMAWYELELQYRDAADLLKPMLSPDSVLAASDVGVLGYYTSAEILDTVGLNSPEALEYYPIDPSYYVINLATSPELVLDTRPDFVVLLEVYGREGLFKRPEFWELYSLVTTIPSEVYTSEGMLVFALRGHP